MSRLGLMFPGQGSQEPGMLTLAAAHPAGAALLAEAAAVLGATPAALLERGGDEPWRNAVAQPLVCATELATWAALRDLVPTPSLLLGYSVGELAAHAAAGTFEAGVAIRLAASRAAAMDRACSAPAGLLGLRGLPLSRLEMVAVQAGCEVAIVNGPEHAVLGGPVAALAEAERLAASAGVTTIQRLRIATPAHTGLLAGAVGSFAEALQAAGPKPSSIPVLSGISGEPCRGGASAVACLSRQLAERLEWGRCLEVAAELGCTVLLDLGPGAALAKMARQALPGVAARAVNEFRSAAGVARWVTSQLAR